VILEDDTCSVEVELGGGIKHGEVLLVEFLRACSRGVGAAEDVAGQSAERR
jgi:hypothetical protein